MLTAYLATTEAALLYKHMTLSATFSITGHTGLLCINNIDITAVDIGVYLIWNRAHVYAKMDQLIVKYCGVKEGNSVKTSKRTLKSTGMEEIIPMETGQ